MLFLIPPWMADLCQQHGIPIPNNCLVYHGPLELPPNYASLLMKRTPMKRGQGFKRPVLERTRSNYKPIPTAVRRGVMAMVGACAQAVEKDAPVRHEGYRRLVASLPCACCGRVGRSQHAHENEGKAKGMKLDDRRAMPLCADEPGAVGCHTLFDQYRLLPGGRPAHVEQGRAWSTQTRQRITDMGLWPTNLPTWTKP